MALANVACLLAETAPVLVVDWDLEAPGLHRFFPPRLRAATADLDLGLDDGPGLIDLFEALRDRLPTSAAEDEDESDRAVAHALDGVSLDSYIRATAVPNVRILRAGRNDDGNYSRRVGTFNWEELFARAPGIYRAVAERLAARHGYVLIDSRTGVTDISGICTYLLPEQLVVVFTPNRQSLTGVRELVERATSYRRSSEDLRPLLVFPLPSRIEASLQDLRTRWRLGDPERGIIGYQPMFQDLLAKCYGLSACDLTSYFDDVQIQQTPDYAYGEEIAVRRSGDRFSMANSYAVFVRRLTSGEPPWSVSVDAAAPAAAVEPEAEASIGASLDEIAEAFHRGLDAPIEALPRIVFRKTHSSETVSSGGEPLAQVFLSFVPADATRVAKVQRELSGRGLRVISLTGSGDLGASFGEKLASALDASQAVVVFWSRESIDSQWVRTAADEGLRRGILVPVLLDDISPPIGLRHVSAADLSRGHTSEAVKNIAAAVHRLATGTPGTIVYPSPPQPPPPMPTAPKPTPAGVPTARSTRALPVALGAAAVLAVLVGGSWLYTGQPSSEVTDPGPGAETISMPNFVGTASADVVKTAELIGLTVSMSDGRSAPAPFLDGVVTGQTPAAGTSVAKSSRVELQIATRTVQVPTLVGSTLDAALPALERSGLRLGKTDTQPIADARPGTIVRQTPDAGVQAAAGAAVDVVVAAVPARPSLRRTAPSSPGALVEVPDVIGLAVAPAEEFLTQAGLRRGRVTTRRAPAYARAGTVIEQSPAAGVRAKQGTAVNIVVAD
jgi:beta-lactam-binding protein with PASTA domain